MRNYNFMRPILILLVAFFCYNLTILIGTLFGMSEQSAENVAYVVMVIGAIITFTPEPAERTEKINHGDQDVPYDFVTDKRNSYGYVLF